MEAAKAFIRTAWANRVDSQHPAPKHPKSALQEWAAAHRRKPPEYELTGKSGPHHNPRFNVTVSIQGVGEATAEGSSKQEAETAAARTRLAELEYCNAVVSSRWLARTMRANPRRFKRWPGRQ